MNDLTQIQPGPPSQGFRPQYEAEGLSAELAKMLTLVAPSSMTVDQQTLWLASAVDALQDIRAAEVQAISAEVRRAITRHNQIVPEISRLVAERRKERADSMRRSSLPPLAEPPPNPRIDRGPLAPDEIAAMPKWLWDMGLRIGFLTRRDGKIIDAGVREG